MSALTFGRRGILEEVLEDVIRCRALKVHGLGFTASVQRSGFREKVGYMIDVDVRRHAFMRVCVCGRLDTDLGRLPVCRIPDTTTSQYEGPTLSLQPWHRMVNKTKAEHPEFPNLKIFSPKECPHRKHSLNPKPQTYKPRKAFCIQAYCHCPVTPT